MKRPPFHFHRTDVRRTEKNAKPQFPWLGVLFFIIVLTIALVRC